MSIVQWRLYISFAAESDKALFMEVTDEQRQLAQQARAYGEQMQALTDTNGPKRKVCQHFFIASLFHVV